jgi:hypothetical protein
MRVRARWLPAALLRTVLLEPSGVLATIYFVDEASDVAALDGHVTLREAIVAANPNTVINDAPAGGSGPDAIFFVPALDGATIALGGAPLTITDTVGIGGPGSDRLVVSRNHASRSSP